MPSEGFNSWQQAQCSKCFVKPYEDKARPLLMTQFALVLAGLDRHHAAITMMKE
tara:strand:- start:2134 stop:2295 length:162 start_codon:yes stop_codon:yes gene_type:complete